MAERRNISESITRSGVVLFTGFRSGKLKEIKGLPNFLEIIRNFQGNTKQYVKLVLPPRPFLHPRSCQT